METIMKYVINGYEPESMFHYFEQISAIPRSSGHEDRIVDFLEEFAKKHGLEYVRDSYKNILIKKSSAPGWEDKPAVLLQGHTDMVCEKRDGIEHDFSKDGLTLLAENGILRADGTTLGGDDGVAVAMMLAILEDKTLLHPRLECLFTSDEEVGMSGAAHFDYSLITAERMINLDSETEGEATVSCAGGARAQMILPCEKTAIPEAGKLLSIRITGLAGGHSGSDIHLQKANADILLARLLAAVYEKTPCNLVSIAGGTKDNAIPREATAVFFTCVPEEAEACLRESEKKIRGELTDADSGFRLKIGKPAREPGEKMMIFRSTRRVLDAILLAPNGVYTKCPTDFSLVESSSNLGILNEKDGNIAMTWLCRSSSESRMDTLLDRYARLAALLEADFRVFNRYPGWEMQKDSVLQRDFIDACRQIYGKEITPRITAIHAGLECGLIISAVDHPLDAISIGPALSDIHTPDEALELSSYERLWKLVMLLLQK